MKIERKSIICSLKPTASPDQANSNPTFSSPTSSRRGIRRQPTAYEPSSTSSAASASSAQTASSAQMASAASDQSQQQQPLKSGWFSNPNLAVEKELYGQQQPTSGGNPAAHSANLTKRVKLAKATKIGRWTSVQSGHLMIS